MAASSVTRQVPALLALGVVTLAGCLLEPDSSSPAGAAAPAPTTVDVGGPVVGPGDAPATTAAPREIELREVDAAGFEQVIASHKGKVVLVDLWATWCVPCVTRFPHVVQLGKDHAGRGLVLVSLSVDEPEDTEKALKFLREQDARFDNLISKYGIGTEATEAFGFPGDVPFYKLYDRTGTLRHQFSGDPREGIEPLEDLEQRVAELLAETT